MIRAEVLFEEYREDVLECLHYGTACVVDRNGPVACIGDSDWTCYYRSASKPVQALPALVRGVHKKYGLTEEETAIFSGSHWGDEEHVRVCESVMAKTGLREDDMIMLPTYPNRPSRREALLRADLPPRKIYHNCSGKHLCLMLLAREAGDAVRDYWKRESRTQRIVREMIAEMSDTPYEDVRVGVDGCGVPVFAVPFSHIARTYLKLSCPELIDDADLRDAVTENMARLHAFPHMIAGRDIVDTIITADPDLIAKSGAMGVYAMGVRSKGLGIVLKVMDGSHDEFADEAVEVLRQLGVAPATAAAIRKVYPDQIVNDNREVVGYRKPVFSLNH